VSACLVCAILVQSPDFEVEESSEAKPGDVGQQQVAGGRVHFVEGRCRGNRCSYQHQHLTQSLTRKDSFFNK